MPQKVTVFLFCALALLTVFGIGYYNYKFRPDTSVVGDDKNIPSSDEITLAREDEEEQKNRETKEAVAPIKESSGVSTETSTQEKQTSDATSSGTRAPVVSVPIPDLNRPLVFPGGYSVDKAAQVEEQIDIVVAFLKEDPNRFSEWMTLALLLKSIEDYEGAREAWEYASAMRPGNALSFANLGMLYGYYLNNPLKAEANFLHSIENEPRFLDFYARMTDFYLDVMKDKSRAVSFLDRAMQKYPEWEELRGLRKYIGD